MQKLIFTGHDTFHCRNYWLKKGLDHIWANQKFNKEAVISLGVGNNMVNSIRFWIRSFGLIDKEGIPNDIAKRLFEDKGFDPFLEDIGTIWLLHYLLVKSEFSSIYSLIFNYFRKERIEFTKEHLLKFLEKRCINSGLNYNLNSLKKDVDVFVKNYAKPERSKSVEDDFSGLLYELNILSRLDRYGKQQWFSIENTYRTELPYQILLFCILDSTGTETVSFNQLLNNINSVGAVFALSSNGLMDKINQILEAYPKEIVFSDDGGVRVLQFKKTIEKWSVLNSYYE